MTHRVGTSLADAVALALYETSFAALDYEQRQVADAFEEKMRDWFEDNWREWLENEDGSLPFETDVDEAWLAGFGEALQAVRDEWKTAAPVERATIAKLGRKLAELRDEGRPEVSA